MAKKLFNNRKITTPEGVVFYLYTDENGRNKPHCQTGPAILYPKGINKPDEYYLYGIKYDYLKWYELTRIPKSSKDASDDFTE